MAAWSSPGLPQKLQVIGSFWVPVKNPLIKGPTATFPSCAHEPMQTLSSTSLVLSIFKLLMFQYLLAQVCLCRFVSVSFPFSHFIYIYTHSFSHTIFHHVLSQETGYGFLCCPVVPHCLSTPNVIVCTCQLQTPIPSHSLPPHLWQPQVYSLYL